ncbi:MAG: 4Fe-4S dicluster domain-containing protein [Deltaproteobacteria bacterium]|nr:4Fe-4S dicluster domain-containing protein [Deltaproteobacteria bacterium]
MIHSRRTFLKIVGLSLAGVSIQPGVEALGGSDSPKISRRPERLGGKRWAMAVNPKKCPSGCHDCIEACHRVHNVPDFKNPKDEIKWIWNEPFGNVFPELEHDYLAAGWKGRAVPVLCNHCANPPCVRVCPTKATFQRKEDGIVMMDYHRCIGCRFCIAGCPYGARSMNYRDPRPFIKEINPEFPTRTKGVVEKCNFCEERLAKGLRPACVQACKEKALVFGDLEDPQAEIRKTLRAHFTIRRKPGLGTRPQIYYIV